MVRRAGAAAIRASWERGFPTRLTTAPWSTLLQPHRMVHGLDQFLRVVPTPSRNTIVIFSISVIFFEGSPWTRDKFGRKKEEAIAALLSHRSIEDAARAIGVNPNTLLRWLEIPEFRDAFRKARREEVHQAVARLQQATGAASVTTLKLMADPNAPAAVRLRAAECVFDRAIRGIEIEDIEARLAALEQVAPQGIRSDEDNHEARCEPGGAVWVGQWEGLSKRGLRNWNVVRATASEVGEGFDHCPGARSHCRRSNEFRQTSCKSRALHDPETSASHRSSIRRTGKRKIPATHAERDG